MQDIYAKVSKLDEILFPDECWNAQTIKTLVSAGNLLGVVRERDSRLIAYAIIQIRDGLVDLMRIGVHPDMQNKGFGTDLLKEVLKLELPTMLFVRKNNESAIRLYKRNGFRVTGRTEASWLMRNRITTVSTKTQCRTYGTW